MKASPDCIPIILSKVLGAVRRVTQDEWLRRKVVNEVMTALIQADFNRAPPDLAAEAFALACRALGNHDPYADERAAHVRAARLLAEQLRPQVDASADPLLAALKLSAASSALEAAAAAPLEVAPLLDGALARTLAVSNADELRADLANRAARVIILAGTAGELPFDRLLIERIGAERVAIAAHDKPLYLGATLTELRAAGIADPGAEPPPAPGELAVRTLPHSGPAFQQAFAEADIVIAKGQDHLMTLEGEQRTRYHLLAAGSDFVARRLGVRTGDLVLLKE